MISAGVAMEFREGRANSRGGLKNYQDHGLMRL